MQATLSVLRRVSSARAARPGSSRIAAIAASLVCLFVLSVGVSSAAAETATYSAIQTVPIPPASNFHGSGGGDGWAVAMTPTAVYNVFHHQYYIGVGCHLQSNAEPCEGWPKSVTESGTGIGFHTAAQPGLYLDQKTGKLYVYATREGDETAGVVCIDTKSTEADPFCGFAELTDDGESPFTSYDSISGASAPMLIGSHWYSFNFVQSTQTGQKNTLMCFDVATDTPCAGEPYTVDIGAGEVSTDSWPPTGETAAIDGKAIIPLNIGGSSVLACFDDATQSSCGGKWPIKLSFPYTSDYGAPYPLMDATGKTIGLCLPTGTDQCFNLEGEEVATPANMSAAIDESSGWDGPSFVLGPRVYTPNGNFEQVDCYDYATEESCPNFPKSLPNLGLLYTVNADPQRPTCIWVNSDDGSEQIQNFDAYTGGACGEGTIRVLASQFVVPQPQCTPANYVSLQVLRPEPSTYTTGTVAFDDGDGNPIAGLSPITLDGTGTAALGGLPLNTPTGLPQFLFTLEGEAGPVGEVEVKLTWEGNYEATCAEEGRATAPETKVETKVETKEEPKATTTTTTTTTTPTPAPKGEVASFGAAHLASSAPACVASNGYVASVGGSLIESVTFTLGGHKVATVTKPNAHGVYATRIKLPVGSKKKLAIKVVFTSASKVHETTIHKTLARCAVVHHITTPRFTG
jgi:hypothetical protein